MAAALVIRSQRWKREHAVSEAMQRKAERDNDRLQKALERIRQMTRIYQERLDGKRHD